MYIYIYIYIYATMKCCNGFVATHALGHIMCYTLVVPMNQGLPNMVSKEHNISGHKWSTTRRVLKSHRSKMSVIYMQSWKQCALSVITTMALWQLIHLGTYTSISIYLYIISIYLYMYIYLYLYLYIYIYIYIQFLFDFQRSKVLNW